MHALVTGANGYIGLRLIPELLERGIEVTALVRDASRFPAEEFVQWRKSFHLVEADFLAPHTLPNLEGTFDAVYYLMHSMGQTHKHFTEVEARVARNFNHWINSLDCRQIIFLSGLGGPHRDAILNPSSIASTNAALQHTPANQPPKPQTRSTTQPLSPHLRSRHQVEQILTLAAPPLTVLRASIIVGSGSASFEIIRSLVEKLPFLITPKWVNSLCQPIAIRNVIDYLAGVIAKPQSYNRIFDIGGPEVLSYRQLLEIFAEERQLHRTIIPVPVFTPKLSSWWLYLITNTNFSLARSLVDSLRNDTICTENQIRDLVPTHLLSYREAIRRAFSLIAQNRIPSTWFDSLISGQLPPQALKRIHVPTHGVLTNKQSTPLVASREQVITSVWSLGGTNGWPSMNFAWQIRGLIDRLIGGTGIRRGRRNPVELRPGDALDFWRVLMSDREDGRLILYAEMKLPGQAWLEFHVTESRIIQTATFRPLGVLGRLYWWTLLPVHLILFPRMAKALAGGNLSPQAANVADHGHTHDE